MSMEPKHPTQPIVTDDDGVRRFKQNKIIGWLFDRGHIDLNRISFEEFPPEDAAQLAQLLGYSVCGFGELSYVSDDEWARATKGEPL